MANTLEKIHALFDTLQPDEYGCIQFTGLHKGPIGWNSAVIEIKRKRYRASRIALERKLKRPLNPGCHALHICDCRSCINPDHLYEGTQKDNMNDRGARNPEWRKNVGSWQHDRFYNDPDYRAKTLENAAKARAAKALKHKS